MDLITSPIAGINGFIGNKMDIVGFIPKEQRQICNKWDRHFIEMCLQIAKMSKDPSTKCGACIVRPDKTIVSTGYNGFPKQMGDAPELYANREVKYSRVVHAEMNALLHSYQNISGCTVYSTPGISCDRCAIHCIQAGMTRCVGLWPSADYLSRWGDMVNKTRSYLIEAKVAYAEIDIDTWEVVTNYDPYPDGWIPLDRITHAINCK